MVFKWFLNGFLNGLFVPLIVASLTSTESILFPSPTRRAETEKKGGKRNFKLVCFILIAGGGTRGTREWLCDTSFSILREMLPSLYFFGDFVLSFQKWLRC